MRTWVLCLVLWLPFAAHANNRPAPAVGPTQLYFLSVGIETYSVESRLPHLYGAEQSARLVAESLMGAGAAFGILLTSDRVGSEFEYVVTRQDIFDAIVDLKRRIRADKAPNPRVVIYMMGHGGGDPVAQANFLVPGDVYVSPADLTQSGTQKLIHSTVWNLDIVSAAVNFRAHESMDYMDEFFPSHEMQRPDEGWWASIKRVQKETAKRQAIVDQRNRDGAFLKGGNAPVPYLFLVDNCFGSVKPDLVNDAGIFGGILRNMFAKLMDEGVTLYAAEPGTNARTVDAPDWLGGSGFVGPLAYRLLSVMREDPTGISIAEMRQKLVVSEQSNPAGWAPYEHDVSLVSDTAPAEILPRQSGRRGVLEIRKGTGG
ncbi:hypothetical protein [Amylibacter sp. IMCC11727]|uniref:hypothetical protein n=1 Tax=Amylibacter sp. IMCC11727 TaxID=3039851 RepID=UPI00244E2301|nr:hypothetical protein [Amylibacter sp. IMCC11727]WGI21704.1 hypothetical protein QBD29_16575 [Amylibacter sp. IMCC11727]